MKMNDIKNEVINLHVKKIEFPTRFSKKAIFRWFFWGGLKVLSLQYYDIYENLKGKRKSETERKQNQLVQEKIKKEFSVAR